MAGFFKKVYQLMVADDPITPLLKVKKKQYVINTLTPRQLIQKESDISRTIFGPLPPHVVRREFFNLDETTWIWHEEVHDGQGGTYEVTTRYELKPRGVLKVQPGPRYTYLEGAELYNFHRAVKAYYERVAVELYGIDLQPQTGYAH